MSIEKLYSRHLKSAWLILPKHQVFPARAIWNGTHCQVNGELVFNTSFNGYAEIITDPSYLGQIIMFTHPHVGSYGIDESVFQSPRPQCQAIVVHRIDDTADQWTVNTFSLIKWLIAHNTPILYGLPTRALTQLTRVHGAMPCQILIGDKYNRAAAELIRINEAPVDFPADFPKHVSTDHPAPFGDPASGRHKVIVYDFGVKRAIIDALIKRGCYGETVPWNTPWRDVLAKKPHGIVLSNGPGDPAKYSAIVREIQNAVGQVPLLAICLGHQLLCQALGGETYKLNYGHRAGNHPVRDYVKDRTFIAAHNHGFAVNEQFLNSQKDWRLWFRNLNDGSLAGVMSAKHRALSVQFHPEGAPGPHDTYYVFDEFVRLLSSRD